MAVDDYDIGDFFESDVEQDPFGDKAHLRKTQELLCYDCGAITQGTQPGAGDCDNCGGRESVYTR